MADITTFDSNFRSIKPKIQANLGSGLVDYTSALQNYCVKQSVESGSYGLVTQQLDADLFFVNPSQNWSKRGLAVQADIEITDNAGASYYTEPLFVGKTSRNRSGFVNDVAIEASNDTSILERYVAAKKTYQNTEITAIVYDLLILAGVSPSNISLTATTYTPSVVIIYRDKSYWEYIGDLLSPFFEAYGFDKDGVFKNFNFLDNVAVAADTVGKPSYSSGVILNYNQANVDSNFLANVVRVKGREVEYLPTTTLFFNTEITGLEVPDAAVRRATIIPVEVEGLEPVEITLVEYSFYTADTGGSLNNSGILLTSSFVGVVDSKPSIRLVFENLSGSTRYLRSLKIAGAGLKIKGSVSYTAKDEEAVVIEGEEIKVEIESDYITSDEMAASLAQSVLRGFDNNNQYYSFEALGKPQVQVGSRVNFDIRQGSSFVASYGIVTEVDCEVSASKGYIQKLTVKKLDTNVVYLICDNATTLTDTNGVICAP